MHCAPRTHIPRISCYTKLLIVVKGLFLQRSDICSNGFGYLFEKNCHPFQWTLRVSFPVQLDQFRRLGLSVRRIFHPFQRLGLSSSKKLSSVRKARVIHSKEYVIRSNGSSSLFKTIISRATVPNHFQPSHFARNLPKNVSFFVLALFTITS